METYKPELDRIKKTFTKQANPYYCGLACLISIVKYHGGEASPDVLQNDVKSASLFDLLQLAQRLGFEAKGFKADVENLKKLEEPVILHILKEDSMGYYVVCYGFTNGRFVLGDPGWGIIEYREEELEAVWQSKALLVLKPDVGFLRKEEQSERYPRSLFRLFSKK
jgi:ABC-type bacteriocin/lantibiotic exporter with double-glycine peptidase domain